MTMFTNLNLKLGTKVERAELERFLELTPEHATITMQAHTTTADRPYESSRTEVSLRAEWVEA